MMFYAVLHIYNILAYKMPSYKDVVIGGLKDLIILEEAA